MPFAPCGAGAPEAPFGSQQLVLEKVLQASDFKKYHNVLLPKKGTHRTVLSTAMVCCAAIPTTPLSTHESAHTLPCRNPSLPRSTFSTLDQTIQWPSAPYLGLHENVHRIEVLHCCRAAVQEHWGPPEHELSFQAKDRDGEWRV